MCPDEGQVKAKAHMEKEPPRWLRSRWLVVALCVASLLPLLFPQLPGLLDVPGHTGRFAVQIDDGRTPELARWYDYHWDILPNLGVDIMVELLSRFVGLLTAVKLSVMAIPFLCVLGILMISRSVHGYVTPPALFVVPVAFGHFFHFGFVNFYLGVGLALVGFAVWRRLSDSARPVLQAALFIPFSCVIWLAHLTGWGFLCVLCGSDELVRVLDRPGRRIRALLIGGLRLSVLLTPFVVKLFYGHTEEGAPTSHFLEFVDKAAYLVFLFRDRWPVWDIASMLLLMGVYLYALRSTKFVTDRAMAMTMAILFGLYLVMPSHLLGSWYADLRLAPLLFIVGMLSIRPSREMSRSAMQVMALAAILFIGLRFAGNAVSLSLWDQQFRKDLSALDAVPRGSTMVTLNAVPCGPDRPWNQDRRVHLSGLAIPLRHVFDNDQWSTPEGQLIQVHNPDAGPFQRSPSGETRERDCRPGSGDGWYNHVPHIPPTVHYLWIVGKHISEPVAGWTKIRDTGSAQLYHR